ncbi:MAG: hypothetical protein KGI45_03700 [Patescibacteria group bacterium]|nr:hypothetical protein [Patescibacteria group bacterium]
MNENIIDDFAVLLEEHTLSSAKSLIVEDLVPIAKKHGITLLAAAKRYANCDADQDTSFYLLGQILNAIPSIALAKYDVMVR